MHGFSTTIVGEKGLIEVLGEGGHNLLWNGQQQHLILHRQGREPSTFRFDEGSDVWQSDISYYSQGHINQVHHFVDSIIGESALRYAGEDGLRAVRNTLAAIRPVKESRPGMTDEIEPDYTAY
jgi:predicted dehydrogenase